MDKNLHQSEEVILTIQDHWILLLRPLMFLILGGTTFFLSHHTGQFLTPNAELAQLLLYLFSYIVLLVSTHFFFILLFQRLISNIVITNKRIIEIQYLPFAVDDINHIPISKISEIKKVKHGIFRNIFNYGEVCMSIAETPKEVMLNYIRRPSKFVNLIEAIQLKKSLNELDLHGIGASVSEKYSSLKI